MVRIFGDESGSIAAPLIVFVGGFSLMLAHNEMKNINNRVTQVRSESQKSFSTQQNVSSVQTAARLLASDNVSTPAPIRLEPYIQAGACDQGRTLTAATGADWQSTANTITVRSYTQTQLQKNGEEVFTRFSQGLAPSLIPDENTILRVLGWKCSSTHPFQMEGVYVEATVSSPNTNDKAPKTKALLAMSPPPRSSCHFYAKDASGNIYPQNKQPVGNPQITVSANTVDLYLACNNVVTDAQILNGGVKLAGTDSYPLTAAHSIDPTLKGLLGPVALAQGNHALQALVEQVDGSVIMLDMTLAVGNTPTPSNPGKDPKTCEYKCRTLSSGQAVVVCTTVANKWFGGGDYYAHLDNYQSMDPTKWVCYKCGLFMGFDPNNNCNMTQVGVRGTSGCFAEDTQIQLEDGRSVAVSALRDGDRIWNPVLGKGQAIHKVIAGQESLPLYRVVQNDSVLRVTEAHPFLTPLGIIAAKDLQAGDLIHDTDGRWTPVQSVTRETEGYGRKVWNFEIVSDSPTEDSHMLLANGIVTGDLYLQKRSISRNLLEMMSMEKGENHD